METAKDTYFTIKKSVENEIVIERSRFITFARLAESEEEARAVIDEIKKLHSQATHNCYAYVTERGMIKRFSDDGEPGGTAGVPILEAISAQKLVDTVVVVTRYFGGIKLGAGGLVRAYSSCATEAMLLGGKDENVFSTVFQINLSYEQFNKVSRCFSASGRKLLKSDYGENVSIEFSANYLDEKNVFNEIADLLGGKGELQVIERKFLR